MTTIQIIALTLVIQFLFNAVVQVWAIGGLRYFLEKKLGSIPNENSEPDTLIENWQQGYIIGISTLLQKIHDENKKHFRKDENNIHTESYCDYATQLTVVKEMKLEFHLVEPGANDYKQRILILDLQSNKQWTPETFPVS